MWLRLKDWYSKRPWFKKYQHVSYVFANFCFALIALNALLGFFLSSTAQEEINVRNEPRVNLRAYQGYSKARLRQVLNDFQDFRGLGSVFRPYIQIGEPPFESSTVNVSRDAHGFEYRVTPSETDKNTSVNIHVFGGGTTFGINLADDWTIPAYLNKALGKKVNVHNYSVRSHSWFQEFVLFQRLVHAGSRPSVAVFIDGVSMENNQWAKNYPAWTWKAARLWEEAQHGIQHTNLPEFIPLFKILNIINKNAVDKQMSWIMEKRYQHLKEKNDIDPEKRADYLRRSYLETVRLRTAIAKSFGIKPYFIWQPNSVYECGTTSELPEPYKKIVPILYKKMRWVKLEGFVNLSRLCKKSKLKDPLFIDGIHYSPAFSQEIAQKIADKILGENKTIRTLASEASL